MDLQYYKMLSSDYSNKKVRKVSKQVKLYRRSSIEYNFNLKFGVPQGSRLGPLLFSLYASKLFKIVESHLPNSHCYADDTQLYIAFRSGNDLEETAAITAMESCIADISQWMHSDKLKLNSDKTECLLIGTRQQLQKVSNISTQCQFLQRQSINLASFFLACMF